MGITTAKALNVRNEPSGSIIDTLPLASPVAIVESKAGWLRVVYMKGAESRAGWVSAKYVRPISATTGGSAQCETEYKSGAEVCIGDVDAELDCNKSFAGEYYRDCDVQVRYELSTDYRGSAYLDVDVSCEAEISYKGRNTFISRSDSDSSSESHSLYANGSDYGSVDFNFSFSSFNEVYRVELESVSCNIDSVDLW